MAPHTGTAFRRERGRSPLALARQTSWRRLASLNSQLNARTLTGNFHDLGPDQIDELFAAFLGRKGEALRASAQPLGHGARRGQVSFHRVLREIAEYPNSFGPLGPKDERIETDRYTLCMDRLILVD